MFKKLFVVAFIYKLAFFDYAYAAETFSSEIEGITNNPVVTTSLVFTDNTTQIVYEIKNN